jgi:hypothetical protein
MGLERRLTDDSAETIFEEKKELLRSIGIAEENLDVHLAETRREYEDYKSVHEMQPHYSASKIADHLGLLVSTVQSWTQFNEVPLLLAKRGYFTKKKRKIKENENHDLAFLLGVYAGSKKKPQTTYFSLTSKEKRVAQMFVRSIYNLTGLLPQINLGKESWGFYHESERFAEIFQKHTLNNTVVPWQLFDDGVEGKSAYLRGFLATRGSLTSNADNYQPGISIDLSRNKSLLKEVVILFSDLGMYPSLTKTRINVVNPTDLKIVYDSGLLLMNRKREKLEEILSGFDSCEEDISIEKFLEIRGKLESGKYGRKEAREAFVTAGANYFTAREWVSTKKTPKRVKRYLKFKKIGREIGDVDAIAYLYKQLGYRKWKNWVGHSRQLAKMLTLDEVMKYQTRQELKENNKHFNVFLFLHEQVGLEPDFSKSLAEDFSKEELEEILFGDVIYRTTTKNLFLGKANLTFWRKYMVDGSEYSSAGGTQKDPRGLVRLSHFFNMFVPEKYVDDSESLTHAYRLFYRKVMSHPASSSFVRIEGNEFYVLKDPRYLRLTETLLSGAGLGGKKRRMNEAKELTEKLAS